MKFLNINLKLIAIIILASLLRFYQLGYIPALNADEAAIGYNAYSLLQTGKDEHGNPFPIHFQSFNDYKPGLYFYLVLPFVKVLGLDELAVRIPGAILGTLTVLAIYLLVKELFKDKNLAFSIEHLALSASFLLAISPWHIHFSRGGWEVNAATFFITTGVWLFLRAVKKPNTANFAFCLLPFALAMYTYHSARIIVPLLGMGLLLIYRKEILKNIKLALTAVVLGALLLIPLGKDFLGPAGLSRAAGVGLLADPGPFSRINEQRGEHGDYKNLAAKLLHNKAVNYGLAFAENWSEHFWGEFLFLSGDEIQRDKVPETGVFYLFDFIFIAAGLVAIAGNSRGWGPVLWWLLVAPAAAALTFQSPHALRAHNMVIPLVIISAYGFTNLIEWTRRFIKAKNLLLIAYCLLLIAVIWNFGRYFHMYYVHLSKEYPFSSQYGVKELTSYISANQGKYPKIYITDRYDQPYILFLFYLKYPAEKFQKDHILTPRDKFGFSTVPAFDKFIFGPIQLEAMRDNPQLRGTLIVGTDEEIPEYANIIYEIPRPDDKPAFQIVAN